MGGEARGQKRLGEVETIEVGKLERRVVGLTAEEVGLTLTEGKGLLGELARWFSRPKWKSSPPAPVCVGTV